MDVRAFGKFLLTLTILCLLAAAVLVVMHKANPPGQSKEAQELRSVVVNQSGPYSKQLDARSRLDEMYAAQEKLLPPLGNYSLLAAALTGVLGIGLLMSTTDPKGPQGEHDHKPGKESLAQQLTALRQLKEDGHLSDAEFQQAKTQLLDATGPTRT